MSDWPSKRDGGQPAKLRRDLNNRMMGGVCAGVADHFNLDVSMVRLVFLATVLFGGTGIMAYLIAWFVIPGNDGASGISYARDQWESSRQNPPRSRRHDRETFDPYAD